MRKDRPWAKALIYALMIVITVIMLIPTVWLFSASFKKDTDIFSDAYPLSWKTFIPTRPILTSYIRVLRDTPFPRYIANTFFVTGVILATGIFVNSMAAFAFAKLDFPLKNFLFVIILITLMIPFEIMVVPLFVLMKSLNWVDSFQALIVPAVANSFVIFMLRQFFSEIPNQLAEAAKIDGASWFGVYMRIFMPLSTPALITVGIIMFITEWRSFFWPLIVINRDEFTVVTVGVSKFMFGGFSLMEWGRLFAAAAIATWPVLLIFLFVQRYYVKGITLTGSKM